VFALLAFVGVALNATFLAGRVIPRLLVLVAPPPPSGTITRVDPADGSRIDPGSSFTCSVAFRNDAEVTHSYYARFVGVGVVSGYTYFDVASSKVSISPGEEKILDSGTQTMPEEDLQITITVFGGS